MQEALNQIREQLVELISEQAKILPQPDRENATKAQDEPKAQAPSQWGENEKRIADGTDLVAGAIRALNEKFFKEIPREFSPVAETQKYVAAAFIHQKESIQLWQSQWPEAYTKGQASLQALKDALAALPQEADNQGQASDQSSDDEKGDESESSEDGESSESQEGESQDGEEGEQGDMESMDATKMDLDSMELPPPTNSPEDVIRRSQEMQGARQGKGGEKKGKPVEKDW
jgi:cell fate (sporulation/competence/biofilm development) regulator YmcA (YheA/YmcA/DUF963 family)